MTKNYLVKITFTSGGTYYYDFTSRENAERFLQDMFKEIEDVEWL